MAKFNHTTIEAMNAKSLIAALSYYNDTIRNKKSITFTNFVERCVCENPVTHHININYNHKATSDLTKYGFVDEEGNVLSIEQAEESFNAQTYIEHSFYHLFTFEEEKVVKVLNKAQAAE